MLLDYLLQNLCGKRKISCPPLAINRIITYKNCIGILAWNHIHPSNFASHPPKGCTSLFEECCAQHIETPSDTSKDYRAGISCKFREGLVSTIICYLWSGTPCQLHVFYRNIVDKHIKAQNHRIQEYFRVVAKLSSHHDLSFLVFCKTKQMGISSLFD